MAKSRKRKYRPHDPAEAARIAWQNRIDPARWGPNSEALAGAQYEDVKITSATREKTARIQRFDCFVTLGITVEQHQAVRRYQDELAIRFGVEGGSGAQERVDGTGCAELVTARSLAAANRLDDLAELMAEPWMLPLIEALSMPSVTRGERVNWHAVVKARIGLIDRDAQSRAVKIASEGVRRAWEAYDKGEMRRAA